MAVGGQDKNMESMPPRDLFFLDPEAAHSLLQAIFESTTDGFFWVDCGGHILGYNKAFLQMWNVPDYLVSSHFNLLEQLQYLADQTLDPESFKAQVLALLTQIPEKRVSDSVNLKDGRVFECYFQPQHVNGEIIGQVWRCCDVTRKHSAIAALRQSEEHKQLEQVFQAGEELARRQTEAILSEREAKYRAIFENSQVGIGRTRIEDGLILEANQRFADIMGYDSPAELISQVQMLQFYVRPSDRKHILDQLHQTNGIRDFELELKRRDSRRIWVLLSLRLNSKENCLEFVITDIYERKRTEDALRQREADYRLLVETANSIILKLDTQGTVLFINDYGQRFFGYPAREIIGRHITATVIPPTESTGRDLAELVADICRCPQVHPVSENENCCKDGRKVWIAWSNKPILDESGQIIGVLSVGIDVTERRRLEEDLRQSQQFLHTIVENLPLVVFSKNIQNDFRYELINQRCERVLGFSKEAGLGKNDHDLLPTELANFHRQQDLEVIAQGRPVETSEQLFRPSTGEHLYIRSVKLTLFDNQGHPTHLLGIGEDFTARKQSELLLASQKQVLELIAADAPLEKTLTLLINAFEKLAQRGVASILLLDDTGQYLQHGIAPNLPKVYQQAIDGLEIGPLAGSCGTAVYRKAPVIVTDTQTDPLWSNWRDLARRFNLHSCWSMPIVSSRDVVLGTFAMYFDRPQKPQANTWQILETAAHLAGIAMERKRTAEELYRAKEIAETANRTKSQFLANMSHELRTPMNAILGFAQLMARDTSLSPQQQEMLTVINTSGEHLLGLINDVLEMSKIEAGTITLNPKSMDLLSLLQTLENMFQIQAEAKQLTLRFTIAAAVPRYIIGDEGKVRQVLINLLGNAIKFTQTGYVALTVQAKKSASLRSQGCLIFAIEDTGPGIPDDVLPSLFKPFVQAIHHTPGEGGSGLGLAISQQFAQLMGGTVEVLSEVGKGSTFTFSMALEGADPPAIAASGATVQSLAPGQPDYRILVVDDRPENRELLVRLLSSVGFNTQSANNGQEAVQQWRAWRPHLIWMDMRMPVMDGYGATRQIRVEEQWCCQNRTLSDQGVEESGDSSHEVLDCTTQLPLNHSLTSPARTTIIALTASAFEDQREDMLAAGCDDFVPKPFRTAEIFHKMADYLGVQYELAETFTTTSSQESRIEPLSPHALKAMPADWLQDLEQAAIQADADWLQVLVEKIPTDQETLATYLNHLIVQLDFETLIDLTETAPGD